MPRHRLWQTLPPKYEWIGGIFLSYLGEDIKKLGFGLMRLPKGRNGKIDLEETKAMVDLFMQAGLTEDIVQKISDEKDDPVWMREFRMKSLQIYRQMQIPDWGPPIDGLDMDHIETYVRPKTKMRGKWSEARSMIVNGFANDVSKELPDFLETFYLQNNP